MSLGHPQAGAPDDLSAATAALDRRRPVWHQPNSDADSEKHADADADTEASHAYTYSEAARTDPNPEAYPDAYSHADTLTHPEANPDPETD